MASRIRSCRLGQTGQVRPTTGWRPAVLLSAVTVGVLVSVLGLAGPGRATAGAPGQAFPGLVTTLPPLTTAPPRTSPATTAPRSVTTAPTRPTPTTLRPTTAPSVGGRTPAVTAPPVRPAGVPPAVRQVPATTVPLPSTTSIAPIGSSLTVAPATVPLHTRGSNAHVDPLFAILSGVGFGVAVLMAVARLLVTRPGGRDRRPLGDTPTA